MCLFYSAEATKKLKRRVAKQEDPKRIVAWKILRINTRGGLSSLCFPHKWKPGWNKARGKKFDIVKTRTWSNTPIVNRGIHVYLEKPRWWGTGCNERFVPVTCQMADLVAAGLSAGRTSEAVFTRVFLRKRDYDKGLKKEPN